MSEDTLTTYCHYHPDIETSLRCNNCEKFICPKDAILTDTGYRCKDCVRQQQKKFDTAEWYDYLVIFFVTGTLSFLGSVLVYALYIFLGFWAFFTIFLSPAIGGGIAEISQRSVGRRRSTRLFQIAALAAFAGSLPLLIISFLGGFNLWGLIIQGYYTFSVTSAVAYRLRGIRV